MVQHRMARGAGYDNVNPREQLRRLLADVLAADALLSRLQAAHENSHEAMIFFAPALVAAVATGVDSIRTRRLVSLFSVPNSIRETTSVSAGILDPISAQQVVASTRGPVRSMQDCCCPPASK